MEMGPTRPREPHLLSPPPPPPPVLPTSFAGSGAFPANELPPGGLPLPALLAEQPVPLHAGLERELCGRRPPDPPQAFLTDRPFVAHLSAFAFALILHGVGGWGSLRLFSGGGGGGGVESWVYS